MPETPEEKWNRVQQKLQQAILTSYPNPERKGCPGAEAILELARQAAASVNLDLDAQWQHVIRCSPCYRDFLNAREAVRTSVHDSGTEVQGAVIDVASRDNEKRRFLATKTGRPEDVFHRVAREEGFWGRYDLSEAGDGFRQLLTDIRTEMNRAFGIQRLSVRANGNHPDLYFDIIEADEDDADAMAFVEDGWAMVGVTQGLFTSMNTLLASACQDAEFVQSFGVELYPPSTPGLFALLYLTTFNFVAHHELGHLVHGHCGSTSGPRNVRKEFVKRATGFQLDIQAGEVEADGYGTHLTLQTLLASPAREHAAGLINAPVDHPGLDQALLESFLTAAICFFHKLHEPFDAALVDERSHPVELSRINTVIADMQGWCEEHRPHLSSWPTKQQFSDLGGLIRHAVRNSGIADTWDAQNSFLESAAGRDYRKRLYKQREILRKQMEPLKWEILKRV